MVRKRPSKREDTLKGPSKRNLSLQDSLRYSKRFLFFVGEYQMQSPQSMAVYGPFAINDLLSRRNLLIRRMRVCNCKENVRSLLIFVFDRSFG